jgi:hypothetical protein
MSRITTKQYKFFKVAWNTKFSLDQAGEKLKLQHHTLRRWFAEERFIKYCKGFIVSQKVRDKLRRQMLQSKAMARLEELVEHPEKIRSENHWRFILEAAFRDRKKPAPPKPSRKNAPPTCHEMRTAKPLRTDKQELLEDIKRRRLAAQKQAAA